MASGASEEQRALVRTEGAVRAGKDGRGDAGPISDAGPVRRVPAQGSAGERGLQDED